ncbi:hypothetical protein HK097_011273 [Rhizophlyctis rosea]|uniref:Guanylate-binding protein N-terminal domain-containing protein n=1 Tax=Rhizophlyctis rosea TaxID=64517 RepID=A0AAD5X7U0_9FUNG|nr:hypothetical protein HK097_011273 [Rhizophlyctis rosea]
MHRKALLFLALLLFLLSHTCQAGDPILLFSRTTPKSRQNVTLTNHNPRLKLTTEGDQFLRSLAPGFAIISIIGPTRTGKSLLMNNLLRAFREAEWQNSTDGGAHPPSGMMEIDIAKDVPFPVGKGVTSKTHGLWIWPTPLDVNGVATYFVDSEGLHGVESVQTQSYEVELFVTACMISSDMYVCLKVCLRTTWSHRLLLYSLYNTWYPVDADDVKNLKSLAGNYFIIISFDEPSHTDHKPLASAFSRLFMIDAAATASSNTDPIPDNLSPPNLHWTVQNFNKHNLIAQKWTAAEFLDQLIRKDTMMEDANVDVRFLKRQFRTLEMVPMARPLDDDAALAGLKGAIRWDEWKGDYAADLSLLLANVTAELRPKQLKSNPISGAVLADLLKSWSDTAPIEIPERTNWDHAVNMKMEHEGTRLLALFDRQASHFLPPDPKNVSYRQFGKTIDDLANATVEVMRNSVSSVGQEPDGSSALALLEKELVRKSAQYVRRYHEWARSHVEWLGDSVNADIVTELGALLDRPEELCKKRRFTSFLEADIDVLVARRIEEGVGAARKFLPTLEESRQLVVKGTYSPDDPTDASPVDIIHGLKRQILLKHKQCPSPLTPIFHALHHILVNYYPVIGVLAGILLLRSAYTNRATLLRAADQAMHAIISYVVPPVLGSYGIYLLTQKFILERSDKELQFLPWKDLELAVEAVGEVVRGSAAVLLTVFGAIGVVWVVGWWRSLWR